MKEKEELLRMREEALEASVSFWEVKIEEALEEHNEAASRFDEDDVDRATEKLKHLYVRALIEKEESKKLEDEISEFCALQAFEGKRKKKE